MATRLGASSPNTNVTYFNNNFTTTMAIGSAAAPRNLERFLERLSQGHRGGSRGQEPGRRDPDLDRREEPGVMVSPAARRVAPVGTR